MIVPDLRHDPEEQVLHGQAVVHCLGGRPQRQIPDRIDDLKVSGQIILIRRRDNIRKNKYRVNKQKKKEFPVG
jgi:hypothetical protein